MTKRCYYLDLTKVLATFLVILGHLYSEGSTLRLYLYSFHMPLFFLVSGVFHKNTGHINWKRYCQTLLWPTFIWIVFSFLLNYLLYRNTLVSYLQFYVIDILLGRHEGVFWFIFALFWCKVFMDVWGIFHRPVLLMLLWLALLFIPVLLNGRLPLQMTQGLMAFPFYFIGYSFKDSFLDRKPSVKYLIPLIACLVFSVLLTNLHGRVSMMSVHFGQMARQFGFEPMSISVPARLAFLGGDVLLFYLNGLVGSAIILCLALLPVPQIPYVCQVSKSLITVFGAQYLLITPLTHYFGLDLPLWVSILLSIGIFALCYVLHLVFRPVYDRVL